MEELSAQQARELSSQSKRNFIEELMGIIKNHAQNGYHFVDTPCNFELSDEDKIKLLKLGYSINPRTAIDGITIYRIGW